MVTWYNNQHHTICLGFYLVNGFLKIQLHGNGHLHQKKKEMLIMNCLLIISLFSFNFNQCSGFLAAVICNEHGDDSSLPFFYSRVVSSSFLGYETVHNLYKLSPHGSIWLIFKCTTSLTDIHTLEMWTVRSKYKVNIMRFCNKKNNCQITQSQLVWLNYYEVIKCYKQLAQWK